MSDDTHKRSWREPPETEAVLALGSFALFTYVTIYILGHELPRESENIAMFILGALIGIVKDTFGRYFQATKGAQDQRKDAALVASRTADAAAALATVAAASTGAAGTTIAVEPDADITVRKPD